MLQIEEKILSALCRRHVWDKYADEFPITFFPSLDAKKVRKSLISLHKEGDRKVIPVSWVERAANVKIPQPLPEKTAEELLGNELLKSHMTRWQKWLATDIDNGEVDLSSVKQDLEELEKFITPGGTNGDSVAAPLMASELVQGKTWETRGTIPTFLHRGLDNYLGGGTGRGQLCLLQAPAKHGKTSLLLTIAYRAAASGLSALFLSSENYLDQIGERLSQIHAAHKRKTFPKKFFVDFRYQMTIKQAEDIVAQLPKLDVIVFDYADNMRAVTVQGDDFVWTINELYDGMRGLANRMDAVVWTASQEKDPEGWQKTSSRARTYGSDKKFHKCDLFLGCIARPQQNTLSIKVLARRGRGKMGEVFHSHFNHDTGEIQEL